MEMMKNTNWFIKEIENHNTEIISLLKTNLS